MTTTDDLALMRVLRAADPARSMPLSGEAALRQVARNIAMRRAPESDLARVPMMKGRRPPVRHTGVRHLAAAAAAVILVAAGSMIVPGLSPTSGESAEAASLLEDAAAASAVVDPPVHPGQWWRFTNTGIASLESDSAGPIGAKPHGGLSLVRLTTVSYVPVDGRGYTFIDESPQELVRVVSGKRPDDLSGRNTWVEIAGRGTWNSPTPSFAAALPRDLQALRDRVYAKTEPLVPDDDVAFERVVGLLTSGFAPSDLRPVLYRVLAGIPGVKVVDKSARVGSRTGVAFARSFNEGGLRRQIVIDVATGEFLAGQTVQVVATNTPTVIPAGTVMSTSLARRDLVDDVPADVLESAQCTQTDHGKINCPGVREESA